jgi:hypothetical protein
MEGTKNMGQNEAKRQIEVQQAIDRLTRERDEARRELEDWKIIDDAATTRWQSIESERDKLRAELGEVSNATLRFCNESAHLRMELADAKSELSALKSQKPVSECSSDSAILRSHPPHASSGQPSGGGVPTPEALASITPTAGVPTEQPVPKPHNPDGLTPEQWGHSDGWRLLDEDEVCDRPKQNYKEIQRWGDTNKYRHDWNPRGYEGSSPIATYRTRLSRSDLAAISKGAK